MHKFLTRVGHNLFRTRNIVFPLLLILVCLLWPPAALSAPSAVWSVVCGLAVLAAGQALRVLTIGLDYIRRGGKDGRIHADRLVTGGVFAICRNPMYSGNVAMVIGFFMLAGNLWGVVVGGAIGWFVYRAIIAAEESFLAERFGDEYRDYCDRVPRWLPAPKTLTRVVAGHRFDWAAVVIREYGTFLTTIAIVLVLLAIRASRAGVINAWILPLTTIGVVALVAWSIARYLKKSRRLRPWNA